MLEVPRYDPTVFDVVSMQEALSIILTPEDEGFDTERRWAVETPWLADLIRIELRLDHRSLVLDYGCGVGRLAKELIRDTGCTVIGCDISPNMRTFASRYVTSPRFAVVAPEMLDELVARGMAFDAAISVWCLQHCRQPDDDIARIGRAMRRPAGLLVVNEIERRVPTNAGWAADDKNVMAMLSRQFAQINTGKIPTDVGSRSCHKRTFWARFAKG